MWAILVWVPPGHPDVEQKVLEHRSLGCLCQHLYHLPAILSPSRTFSLLASPQPLAG